MPLVADKALEFSRLERIRVMNDHQDSIGAVQTTIGALRAAGVEPMAITVSLIIVAMQLYREEFADDVMSEQDLKMLLTTVTKGELPG